MLPSDSVFYSRNRVLFYTKFHGQLSNLFIFQTPFYFNYLFNGKACIPDTFSFGVPTSVFSFFVDHVFSLGSKKQVVRIDARWSVA
jgi:hypothetical protein